MEKLSRYLWSMLLFVYSSLTKNSAVDSLCQYLYSLLCNLDHFRIAKNVVTNETIYLIERTSKTIENLKYFIPISS
jgi:hypothetical protein